MRVWQDAVALYALASRIFSRIFSKFPFVLMKVASSDAPEICDQVRRMVNIVVELYRDRLFPSMCGSCKDPCEEQGREEECIASCGMCVTHLEYIILAGGCLTAVSSSGKFVREELTGGALLTSTELIKELLAAHLKKDAGSQPVPAEQTDQLAEDGLCPENAPEERSFQASLFRCRRCGQCCRDLEIIVTPRDVERISRHLGKDLAEKEYLSPDRFTWSVYNRVLAKSNERQGEKWPAPGCLFLEESDGISSCAIYEARPSACRRYLPGTERCLRSMHHNHLPG